MKATRREERGSRCRWDSGDFWLFFSLFHPYYLILVIHKRQRTWLTTVNVGVGLPPIVTVTVTTSLMAISANVQHPTETFRQVIHRTEKRTKNNEKFNTESGPGFEVNVLGDPPNLVMCDRRAALMEDGTGTQTNMRLSRLARILRAVFKCCNPDLFSAYATLKL